MKRRHRTAVSVTVDVDVDDVLYEIGDDQLLAELKSRKVDASGLRSAADVIDSDWLDRLHWYLQQRDVHGALAMVSAALSPARAIPALQTDENFSRGSVQ